MQAIKWFLTDEARVLGEVRATDSKSAIAHFREKPELRALIDDPGRKVYVVAEGSSVLAKFGARGNPMLAIVTNPKRPTREFMRRCMAGVGPGYDPGAVCAAQWHKMSPGAKRRWLSKENPTTEEAREMLRHKRQAACPKCGWVVRGSAWAASKTCPKCGTQVDLKRNPGPEFHKARYRAERGSRDANLGRAAEARRSGAMAAADDYERAAGVHDYSATREFDNMMESTKQGLEQKLGIQLRDVPEDEAMRANPEWYGTSGRARLRLTREQARSVSGPGSKDEAVAVLVRVPSVARQLARISPQALRDELREYGAWDDAQLADHEQNLQRWVWIVGNDITEEFEVRGRRNPGRWMSPVTMDRLAAESYLVEEYPNNVRVLGRTVRLLSGLRSPEFIVTYKNKLVANFVNREQAIARAEQISREGLTGPFAHEYENNPRLSDAPEVESIQVKYPSREYNSLLEAGYRPVSQSGGYAVMVPTRNNPSDNVFKRHQLRIAKDTLRMTPVMARVMGGMSVEEAVRFLRGEGYTDAQIEAVKAGPRRNIGLPERTGAYDQVGAIMAYEGGELDTEGTLELFSSLIKTGMVNHLQGHYGRTAHNLISAGWLDARGNILKRPNPGEVYHREKAAHYRKMYGVADDMDDEETAERHWAQAQAHLQSAIASKRMGINPGSDPVSRAHMARRMEQVFSPYVAFQYKQGLFRAYRPEDRRILRQVGVSTPYVISEEQYNRIASKLTELGYATEVVNARPNPGTSDADAAKIRQIKGVQEWMLQEPKFLKALQRYVKFHGCWPVSLTKRDIAGIGSPGDKDFFVNMGKAPDVSYIPTEAQKGSNKYGSAWLHEFNEGGNPKDMSKLPDRLCSGDGKTIITHGGKFAVEDWVRK